MVDENIQKQPKTPMDKHDLKAHESLLSAKGYILFTLGEEDDDEGDTLATSFSKLTEMEILGFLTNAINSLEIIKQDCEEANVFKSGRDDVCNECRAKMESELEN
jgi:hypothetical protein